MILARKIILSLAALSTVLACSAIVTEDAVQCSADADCASRGPDFEGTICGTNGFCQVRPPAPPECTKHSDCKSKGEGFVCSALQQKCTSLANDQCSVAYGDPTEDGTVILGLLSEIDKNDTLYFRQQQHLTATKLAFREYFEKSAATLPGGRKAALVACTEHFPRKAAAHLANIGALAVIGPSDEARQRAVVETLAQGHVPSFSPWINGNPSAVVPESAGVAWIASFLRPEVVAPLNALVAEQETKIRTQKPSKTSIRVAAVINKPTTSTFNTFAEYGDLMDQRLVFNGKSAVENQRDPACGACYQRFETSQAAKAVVEERANAIVEFKPDIIVPFADIDWGAQLLPKLEEIYKTKDEATYPRPIYVQAFLQIEEQGYKFLNVGDPGVRTRITGIRPVRDNSFELFQNKFRDAYRPPSAPDKLGGDPNPGAGRAFETALLLLFASHAALVEDPAAGPQQVVAALKKVTDKSAPTKVTLNDIPNGVARLNAKESIDLAGLFTSFAFDEKTQSARASWATWCVTPSATYTGGTRVFANGSFGPTEYCP